MEQFRKLGEELGGLKALMLFQDNIEINPRQCRLLLDICNASYDTISDQILHSLKFEERQVKWRVVEQPLREICRIFKEVECYIRQCLETTSSSSSVWWAKAIVLHQNRDSVEFHIHSLISTMPAVIEAIEIAGEFSGSDQEEGHLKRVIVSNKYHKQWSEPKLFELKFSKQYLVSKDLAARFERALMEDRWILMNKLREMKLVSNFTKQERQLADLMTKRIEGNWKMMIPCTVLVGSRDYQVRRRLGSGSQYKEIQWLGESFAVRHFFGNIEPMIPEIVQLGTLCHPNVLQLLCGFTDEDKKECFLLSELMACRDIGNYIKEACGSKNSRRLPFSLPVAIDLMLQIARGMEYLHSKKVFHGSLNPSNILVRGGGSSLLVKVSGFGLSTLKKKTNDTTTTGKSVTSLPFIWSAPEVLEEQDDNKQKFTEKSDVYSFAMVCFEILTGKVPFEDSHLQGDRMGRNIRAGERPLFPSQTPKFVANFTKRCWHPDPNFRPRFSTICRILRYAKKFLLLTSPNSNEATTMNVAPLMDYLEIDSRLRRRFQSWETADCSVSEVPFQMFAYKVMEMERTQKETPSDSSGSDMSGDEAFVDVVDPSFTSPERNSSTCSSSHRGVLSSSPETTTISSPGLKRSSSSVFSKRASLEPSKTTPKHSGKIWFDVDGDHVCTCLVQK
ncbi:Light-sensor Protein kinase [Linum perenne]